MTSLTHESNSCFSPPILASRAFPSSCRPHSTARLFIPSSVLKFHFRVGGASRPTLPSPSSHFSLKFSSADPFIRGSFSCCVPLFRARGAANGPCQGVPAHRFSLAPRNTTPRPCFSQGPGSFFELVSSYGKLSRNSFPPQTPRAAEAFKGIFSSLSSTR